jgi:hypothetical protein
MNTTASTRLLWALVASVALHGAVLMLPSLALPRALRAHDTVVTPHRASEPRTPAESVPPPEVLKNTIEPSPDLQRAAPKPPPPAPSPAGTKPKPRPPAERLAGETLDRTLGQLCRRCWWTPAGGGSGAGLKASVVVML